LKQQQNNTNSTTTMMKKAIKGKYIAKFQASFRYGWGHPACDIMRRKSVSGKQQIVPHNIVELHS
jgi:hypothetical protein